MIVRQNERMPLYPPGGTHQPPGVPVTVSDRPVSSSLATPGKPDSPLDLAALPKAHLHLHLTGAMRHPTMVELAKRHRVTLPPALTQEWPPQLSTADERGWFRFQRLYDTARSVLRTPDDLCRLVREIAEDARAQRSRWLETQADPSGFTASTGGGYHTSCTHPQPREPPCGHH